MIEFFKIITTYVAKHKPLVFSFAFALLYTTMTFAAPYTTSDAMLNPTCAPGSTDCYVALYPDQTGNSGKYLTTNGTAVSWANVASGGGSIGDTVGSGTVGSVLFIDSSGFLAQAPTSFYYNSGTDRLGVGTNAPAAKIHSLATAEQLRLGYDSLNYWTSTVSSTGGLTMQGVGTGGSLTLSPTAGQNLNISLSTTGDFVLNTNQFYVDTSTGYIGIGDATPSYILDVSGDASINGVNIGMGGGSVVTNTAVGASALNANTSGSNNTAVGASALVLNTSGVRNSAIGSGALAANTLGSNNTAFGYQSMNGNTIGSLNTAFGFQSLFSNTTGNLNTAIGYEALRSNTTGESNVALGYGAGYNSAVTGTYTNNILLGYQAGNNITDGATGNIIIGHDLDLPTAGGTGQMTIGNLIFATGLSATGTTISNGSVGIGTATPATQLHITGVATLPTIIGGSSTTQDLTFQTTSGVGATGADMHFLVGSNGATEAMTILNSGVITKTINESADGFGSTYQTWIGGVNSAATLSLKNYSDGASSNFNGQYFNGSNSVGLSTSRNGGYVSLFATQSAIYDIGRLGGLNPGYSTDSSIRLWWATTIYNQETTTVGLTIQGKASQTVSLQEWQNSSGNVLASISGVSSGYPILKIPVAPTASANYGLVSLGSGAFDGSTSGFFTGSASGTGLAMNLASGSASDLMNLQVSGASRFKLDNHGHISLGGDQGYTAFTVGTNDLAITSSWIRINSASGVSIGTGGYAGAKLDVLGGTASGSGTSPSLLSTQTSNATSGTLNSNSFVGTFASGAGSANFRGLAFTGTINNSGAQSGTFTDIFSNTTETSLNGMTHNLMDLQVGGVSKIKAATDYFEVNSIGQSSQIQLGYTSYWTESGVWQNTAGRALNLGSTGISNGGTVFNLYGDGGAATIRLSKVSSTDFNFIDFYKRINLGTSTNPWKTFVSDKISSYAAPTASANYGLVSLGSGAFDGSTSGYFAGNSNGTGLAMNLASGSTSDLLNLQIAGVTTMKNTKDGYLYSSGGLWQNSGSYLYLASSGGAGVAPDSNWTFGKDGSHNINVRGASTGTRAFQVLDSASSDAVRFHVDFGTGVSYLNGGNFGLGTTSPEATLQLGTVVNAVPANTSVWLPGAKTLRFGSNDSDTRYGSYLSPNYGSSGSLLTIGIRNGSVDRGGLTLYSTGTVVNAGLGTTSPVSTLHIATAPVASANYGLVSLGSGAFDGATSGFFTGSSSGTIIAANQISGGTADLINLQLAGANRFKVTSAGYVGINATTPTVPLDVTGDMRIRYSGQPSWSGWNIGQTSGAHLAFSYPSQAQNVLFLNYSTGFVGFSNNLPDARIAVTGSSGNPSFWARTSGGVTALYANDSGNVGVGESSPLERFQVTGSNVGGAVAYMVNTDTGSGDEVLHLGVGAATAGTSNLFVAFYKGSTSSSKGTRIGYIQGDGAGGVSYNTTSDARLKENFDLDHPTTVKGLIDLLNIKVVDFNYIGAPGHTTQGFIAQQLNQVYPYAVVRTDNGTDVLTADSIPWGVDYGRLTPLLVKSIQEIDAKIVSIENLETDTPFIVNLREWLASTANGIQKIFSKEVETENLCVSDAQGKTCITKSQLDLLLLNAGTSNVPESNTEGSSSSNTSGTTAGDDTGSSISIDETSSTGGDGSNDSGDTTSIGGTDQASTAE